MIHVLVPTDFSENSEKAFFYALELLKGQRCAFYLTHIQPENNNPLVHKKHTPPEVAKKQLQLLINKAENFFSEAPYLYFSQLLSGNIVNCIREEVTQKNISLIVLGCQGSSASTKSVGSTALDIIRKVVCATLIVPQNQSLSFQKNMVLLTDYSIFFGAKFLETISFYQNQNHSQIHIVYLSKNKEKLIDAQKKNKELLQQYFADNPHQFNQITSKNLPVDVAQYAVLNEVNLIAVSAKDLHICQQLLLQPSLSPSSQLAFTPLLVLH